MQTKITDFVDKKEQLLADLAAEDKGRQLELFDSNRGVADDSKQRDNK